MTIAQEVPSEVEPNLAENVMESVGMPEGSGDQVNESHESAGAANPSLNGNDPVYVQKRLKQQRRQHEREMRELHAKMAQMQANMTQTNPSTGATDNLYPQGQTGSVGDQIQQAVQMALNHREMQEKRQKEMESQAHLQNQYKDLNKHLDDMNDVHDDFDDVVRNDNAAFTPAMRDFAMTLPKKGAGSAGEVLYHLGKNPEELKRISKLHPLDQAAEMNKLSHALISGGDSKATAHRAPLGQIKSAPVTNSHIVTDKTPVGSIRKRMQAGTWK